MPGNSRMLKPCKNASMEQPEHTATANPPMMISYVTSFLAPVAVQSGRPHSSAYLRGRMRAELLPTFTSQRGAHVTNIEVSPNASIFDIV